MLPSMFIGGADRLRQADSKSAGVVQKNQVNCRFDRAAVAAAGETARSRLRATKLGGCEPSQQDCRGGRMCRPFSSPLRAQVARQSR